MERNELNLNRREFLQFLFMGIAGAYVVPPRELLRDVNIPSITTEPVVSMVAKIAGSEAYYINPMSIAGPVLADTLLLLPVFPIMIPDI